MQARRPLRHRRGPGWRTEQTGKASRNELRLRAPAKINWSLAVIGRRRDGYHEIDTVMQTVSLTDHLRFRRSRRATCAIQCNNPQVPAGPDNLIHRAWRLLRDSFASRVGGISVRLTKNIPMGAGLGGGSSDGAATLLAIDRLYGLRLGRGQLAALAAGLGSDVAFFIQGGAARCRGRGEIVEPLRSRLPALDLIVVFPGSGRSTARAYGSLTAKDFQSAAASSRVARAIERGDPGLLRRSLSNTFDRKRQKGDRRHAKLKQAMQEAGIVKPMLCGSGSACFGLVKDRRSGAEARDRLLAIYPQVYLIRTRSSGVTQAREPG